MKLKNTHWGEQKQLQQKYDQAVGVYKQNIYVLQKVANLLEIEVAFLDNPLSSNILMFYNIQPMHNFWDMVKGDTEYWHNTLNNGKWEYKQINSNIKKRIEPHLIAQKTML